MRKYGSLVFSSLYVSFKKTRAYNMEFMMMLVHVVFSFAFVFLFWSAILYNFSFPSYWTASELYFFAAIVLLADAIGEIFFPLKLLPSVVVSGDLSQYLIRPVNTLSLFLMANMNIIAIVERIGVSIVAIVIVAISQEIALSAPTFILALLLMITGIVAYQILYATFSLTSFWFGEVSFFRDTIFEVGDFKRYPLDVFSKWLQKALTFILPVSLIVFFPASLILGKICISWTILFIYSLVFILSNVVFKIVWKAGLRRYEANS